mmetsp:Transcript_3252/g.7217  ORF Transcript_3252/g.7217 Transcript_3252/m.7217 type:complete len:119 (-) Transcript_3252:65-421(-)
MAVMKSEFPPRSPANEASDAETVEEAPDSPVTHSPAQRKVEAEDSWVSLSLARPVEDGSWLTEEVLEAILENPKKASSSKRRVLEFYIPDDVPTVDLKDVIMADDDWEAFERAVLGDD